MIDIKKLCGWIGIDEKQMFCAQPFAELRFTAPQLMMGADPTEPVLLYNAYIEVLGEFPPYPAQEIGDCVGQGHGHANNMLQCIEISLGEPTAYSETDTEFIYAASREVAGILGPNDGSYGSAAVKAMTTMGMVSREMVGNSYSGKEAKKWGSTGPPEEFKQEAKNYLLGDAALVTTWEELVGSIKNGYPVTICTGMGFTMTRDKQGFCVPKGQWGHCMHIGGLRFDRPGACIIQSWGPNVPDGPVDLGQPDYSFWADKSAIVKILAEKDSWALTSAPGFKERDVPTWTYDRAA